MRAEKDTKLWRRRKKDAKRNFKGKINGTLRW